MRLILSVVVVTLSCIEPVSAFKPLRGFVISTDTCEAYQSKNSLNNPGSVKLQERVAYKLLGSNTVGGDYFHIVVPDAPVTSNRWVATKCGIHVVEAESSSSDEAPITMGEPQTAAAHPAESTDNVLALSWQPAFCEQRPEKSECVNLNEGRLPVAATLLSIHGLWAQPKDKLYCSVSAQIKHFDTTEQWHKLPEPKLSDRTRRWLAEAMPGSASLLHRHEWIKHGTCHFGAGGAEEYFIDALRVTQAINQSVIGAYFQDHVGSFIQTTEIRKLFDNAFGVGAGDRVQFHCTSDSGRILLQELKISLQGVINQASRVSDLMLAAEPVTIGCPHGFIDPAGLQ